MKKTQLMIFLALATHPAQGQEAEPRNIGVGEIDVLELDFVPAPDPLVGNKAVVELREGAHPRQIYVTGLKKGTSSVFLHRPDGSTGRRVVYSVSAGGLDATVIKVRKLLFSVEGITVQALDQQVVIDGEVLTAADKLRVQKVAAAYENVLDLTTISKLGR